MTRIRLHSLTPIKEFVGRINKDRLWNLFTGAHDVQDKEKRDKALHKDMSDPCNHLTDQNPKGLKTSFDLIKFLSEGKKLSLCKECGFPIGYHPCVYFGEMRFHDNFIVAGECFIDVTEEYECGTCKRICYCDNPTLSCGR